MTTRILFIDDEERILRSLALQFRRQYEVLTESDPLRALERLKTEQPHIIVCDQRMPQMTGAQLLERAREIAPATLRILLTGYSDMDAAVDALNSGGIFRYLSKPWDQQEMAFTLRQAAEIAARQTALPTLLSVADTSLNVLLLDEDADTLACVGDFCAAGGHRLLRARTLAEAVAVLNSEAVHLLVSDLKLAGEDTAPLLKSLAQAHPGLLSLVITPFCDTQALLKLINEAQIFRYLPKPIRRGLFEKGLKAAAEQAASAADQSGGRAAQR
jgi:DNA-binding NtrC family response regulator